VTSFPGILYRFADPVSLHRLDAPEKRFMSIDTYKITRHTIQFLTKRVKETAQSMIVLRLYDDDNVNRAIVIFEDHAGAAPPKPTGDHARQQATAYLDIAHHIPYMDILRREKTVYLKMGWTQQGKVRLLSQISIDTKKEVLGEFFAP